jgi:hypothetical protein
MDQLALPMALLEELGFDLLNSGGPGLRSGQSGKELVLAKAFSAS